jgi:hypothetical protein
VLNVLRHQFIAVILLGAVLSGVSAMSAVAQYNSGGGMPYNPGYGVAPSYNTPSGAMAPLQGRVVTAPSGTFFSAALSNPISSQFAHIGDRFTAILGSDLASGGAVVLPSGSQLEGQVVSVIKAGMAGRNGQLDVRFTSAILPNGQRVPLSARIQTADGTGIIKGGTSAGRLGRAAINTGLGAGLGAALGTAMGPLSGGGVGRGAIYGTVLGSGMGLLASGAQKGQDAVIQSGQPLQVLLDQPLTVSGAGGYAPAAPMYQSYPQNYAPQNYGQNNSYDPGSTTGYPTTSPSNSSGPTYPNTTYPNY